MFAILSRGQKLIKGYSDANGLEFTSNFRGYATYKTEGSAKAAIESFKPFHNQPMIVINVSIIP